MALNKCRVDDPAVKSAFHSILCVYEKSGIERSWNKLYVLKTHGYRLKKKKKVVSSIIFAAVNLDGFYVQPFKYRAVINLFACNSFSR